MRRATSFLFPSLPNVSAVDYSCPEQKPSQGESLLHARTHISIHAHNASCLFIYLFIRGAPRGRANMSSCIIVNTGGGVRRGAAPRLWACAIKGIFNHFKC